MKVIRNTTHEPIRVPLSGDRVLHLGPAKTGQVADDALDRAAFRKLVESGAIEIVGEGTTDGGSVATEAHARVETHGHHPTTVVMPKGNR